MKVICNVKQFNNALKEVALSGVIQISTGDKSLVFVSGSSHKLIEITIPAIVEEAGSVVISAAKPFPKVIGDNKAEVTVWSDTCKVFYSIGLIEGAYLCNTYVHDGIDTSALNKPMEIVLDLSPAMIDEIRYLQNFMHTDEFHSALRGVYVDCEESFMRLVATNTRFMAIEDLPVFSSTDSFLIPSWVFSMIAKTKTNHVTIYKLLSTETSVEVRYMAAWNNQRVIFDSVEKFPNWRNVLPKQEEVGHAVIDSSSILEALKTLEPIWNTGKNARDTMLLLHGEGGNILLGAMQEEKCTYIPCGRTAHTFAFEISVNSIETFFKSRDAFNLQIPDYDNLPENRLSDTILMYNANTRIVFVGKIDDLKKWNINP